MNCSEVPGAIDPLVLVIVIEASTAGVTVNANTLEVTVISEAVMLAEPGVNAFARPVVPMAATPVFDELQVT